MTITHRHARRHEIIDYDFDEPFIIHDPHRGELECTRATFTTYLDGDTATTSIHLSGRGASRAIEGADLPEPIRQAIAEVNETLPRSMAFEPTTTRLPLTRQQVREELLRRREAARAKGNSPIHAPEQVAFAEALRLLDSMEA